MHIKINDRDVAPQNVAEAALEKEIRSIHFELNEQFSFDNAFEAMFAIGSALGRVEVGEPEEPKLLSPEEFTKALSKTKAEAEAEAKAEESNQMDWVDLENLRCLAEAEAETETKAKAKKHF
jgi:hypothetical protein